MPQHLNLKIKDKFEIIAFNEDKNYENYLNFNEKTILLELQKNNYSKNSIKGILKYVSFNKPNLILQEKLKASLLSQFNYFNDNFKTTFKQYTSLNQLSNIIDNKTLFLTYNINFNLKDSFCCSFNLNNKSNLKTLCYGLNSFENLERFDKIILIEYPINEEFIYNLRKFSQVYVPLNKSEKLNLVTDRTDFLDVYFALQKSIAKNYNTNNLYDYYLMLKRNFDIKFDYAMFYISLEIFKELNLIEEKLINNNLSFKFNKIKTELENSKIYNKIINYRS